MRGLRIGVNALYLIPGGVGGTEIYLRALLQALAEIDGVNQYFVFTNSETGPDLVPRQGNFRHVPLKVRATFRPARIVWEQTALPMKARRLRLDVLFNPGFTAPLVCPCPQVTVFHDLQHKRHPGYFRWFDLPFWNVLLYGSSRVSETLLADSPETAADLLKHYQLPPSKVRVLPLGVDPVCASIRERRRPERFLLTVSTLHPHKNLDGLLHAFAIFRQTHPDFRLVVCGMHGFASAALHNLRRELGLDAAVDFPGWVAREQVYDLYARAWAAVFPSRFEGFGMPVLEALAAGIPTACSNVEPMASNAGDAALQFDPDDRDEMARALARIVDDQELRRRLPEAGPLQAARFSWRATAEATLKALTFT